MPPPCLLPVGSPLTQSAPRLEWAQGEQTALSACCGSRSQGPQRYSREGAACPAARSSLAALGHVPEQLLTLVVVETPQAVGALQVPLASAGRSGVPALCRDFQPLGSSPRPLASRHCEVQSIGL